MSQDLLTANALGVNFVTIQVRDLERSRRFYAEQVGLPQKEDAPPNAAVFATEPIPMALRQASIDLDAVTSLGWGIVLWLKANDPDALSARLSSAGVKIIEQPCDSACGRTFVFEDPDGYRITVHDR